MLTMYKWFFMSFFFSGLFSFFSKKKHLLSTLFSLEFMVLSVFFYMFVFLIFNYYDLYFLIYFLTFSVCEGALGLSILVSMIRSHGSDYFIMFNMLQC
uniref:NADH-ubiquinone oxidoreductase chain 4L n=1 Tax=Megaloprepus caerulatus TaxID=263994 RepID=A0A342ZZN6_9ODON|nr:NADH dehydrogenase subunit 4L [Megaloprepus caerulatus]AOW43837.1 NADH dehydrogenase subunit 4L [Megaloprepus caerulatus]